MDDLCSIDLDELSTDLANSRKSDELSGKPVTAPSIEVCLAGIHGQDAAKTAIPHRSQDFTGAVDGIEDDLAALASYTQTNSLVAAEPLEGAETELAVLTLSSIESRMKELFPEGQYFPVLPPKLPPVVSEATYELCSL